MSGGFGNNLGYGNETQPISRAEGIEGFGTDADMRVTKRRRGISNVSAGAKYLSRKKREAVKKK